MKYKIKVNDKKGKERIFDVKKIKTKYGDKLIVKPVCIKTKNKDGGDDIKIIMPPLELLNEIKEKD